MVSELKLLPNLRPESRLGCSVDWLLSFDLAWESLQAAKWLLAFWVMGGSQLLQYIRYMQFLGSSSLAVICRSISQRKETRVKLFIYYGNNFPSLFPPHFSWTGPRHFQLHDLSGWHQWPAACIDSQVKVQGIFWHDASYDSPSNLI